MTAIESQLARDGKLVYRVRGVSMEPMLRQNRDLVILRPPAARLKKYDVALYRRGGDYVLHRVIGTAQGQYRIRGDNTYSVETVPEEAVVAVLAGFVRKGVQYAVTDRRYTRYVRFWCAVYPVRALLTRMRGRLAPGAGQPRPQGRQ